jgi:hypothetical protein
LQHAPAALRVSFLVFTCCTAPRGGAASPPHSTHVPTHLTHIPTLLTHIRRDIDFCFTRSTFAQHAPPIPGSCQRCVSLRVRLTREHASESVIATPLIALSVCVCERARVAHIIHASPSGRGPRLVALRAPLCAFCLKRTSTQR